MVSFKNLAAVAVSAQAVFASCPYMGSDSTDTVTKRDDATGTDQFLKQFELDDTDSTLTNQFGVPIDDQESLKAGERGPTLLEDFIFREKIMHFGKQKHSHICSASLTIFRPRTSSCTLD